MQQEDMLELARKTGKAENAAKAAKWADNDRAALSLLSSLE